MKEGRGLRHDKPDIRSQLIRQAKNQLPNLTKLQNCHQKSLLQTLKSRRDQLEDSGLELVTLKVIHNFDKKILVSKEELKLLRSGKLTQQPVVPKKNNELPVPPKPIIAFPDPPVINEPKPQQLKSEVIEPKVIEPKNSPGYYEEFKEDDQPRNIGNVSDHARSIQVVKPSKNHDYKVYRLGDVHKSRRVLMAHLGIDVGTKTVVVAYRGENDETGFISEINGYWVFERATPFIENMLNDPDKARSDGTKRPARWIKMPDSDQICVLGRDAEEFAYAKNDTLLRPMAEGGISADEEAMTILASIVQGLMEMAENEIGKFGENIKIVYCTTAPAVNKDSNIEYHKRVVDLIIEGYETDTNIEADSIKESHAIVLNESPDGTGIGISWGAGTVTVSYIKYGLEIYSFCWVGAGDWIDEQVAMRHGYNPEAMKTRRKVAKETPTTVAKRKMQIDLTPGTETGNRIDIDIRLHYDVLISQVIDGIVQGFIEHEAEARIDDSISVYMAGGTSSPNGFEERVAQKFEEKDPPFEIANVLKSNKPLYCVAEGCLKAAEMF